MRNWGTSAKIIYANQTRPLRPLCQCPNFISTYHGLTPGTFVCSSSKRTCTYKRKCSECSDLSKDYTIMQHFLGLLWGIVKMWIIYFLPTGAGAGGPLQNKHLCHSSGCQQQGGGVQGAPWKGEKAPDREIFFFITWLLLRWLLWETSWPCTRRRKSTVQHFPDSQVSYPHAKMFIIYCWNHLSR